VACLTAAVSPNDAGSLFRVAALPQFAIDPAELRAAMRAMRRELDLRSALGNLQRRAPCLRAWTDTPRDCKKTGSRRGSGERLSSATLRCSVRLLVAFVNFVEELAEKSDCRRGSPPNFWSTSIILSRRKGPSRSLAPTPTRSSYDRSCRQRTRVSPCRILRGSSTSFPCSYKEPLIAFPAELRRSGASTDDPKALHEQEERRLYYVAMTRAKDTLAIYAQQGKGKTDPRRQNFCASSWRIQPIDGSGLTRSAAAVQDHLFAEEEQRIALEHSNVAAWLLMDPSSSLYTGLSASAIEIYEQCPLRFKLEREWNLPRDVSAALHYGGAMHAVLKTFYDAQRYQREIGDDDLLEQFRFALAGAGIADRYQYELYLRQGKEQLLQFLDAARAAEAPDVIETEHKFELKVGTAKLAGRLDRLDRTGPDTVAIVDYKTGKPKTQEDADESLQLSLYAIAAQETLGKRADRLIFHNHGRQYFHHHHAN
jgi:hypothetical protein